MTATVLKNDQNKHEIKRTVFNWTKMGKTCKISRKSSFQASYNIETEKQFIQLILCQLDVGSWRTEQGTRLCSSVFLEIVPVMSCFVQLKSALLISPVFWTKQHFFVLVHTNMPHYHIQRSAHLHRRKNQCHHNTIN